MITQEQYNVCLQRERTDYVKIELMNENETIIDILEGKTTDGSISINADSDIRRTCDLKFYLTNDFIPRKDSRIWLNKRFRLQVGVFNLITDEIVWFDKGIYIIDNPEIDINISERTISIKGLDKMFLLTGETGKGLLEYETTIPANASLYNAIKGVITSLGKETKLLIDDNGYQVPYKIEKSPTENCYDLLKQLRDLYMNMEMFYREDGYFVFQKIKNRLSSPVDFTFDEDIDIRINSRTQYDFHNVRNYVKVLGKKNETTGVQPQAEVEIIDVNSDFHKNNIGRRPLYIQDDNYTTVEQCQVRANYELEIHGNLGETIDITIPCLYFLDVNKVIEFKNRQDEGLDGKYLIQSISFNLKSGSTMNVTAKKIYN